MGDGDSFLFADLYDKKIEKNRFKIVKYVETTDFLDQLRENGTISPDDADEINVYGPRRKRAGKFLDILQTKGDSGVKFFLQTIELIYPDLYQEITGELPRKPPPNLKPHSPVQSPHLINHLPQIPQGLNTQYQNSRESVKQLQELEHTVLFEQNDNRELDRENAELRKQIETLKKDKSTLETQVATFMEENRKLRDDSRARKSRLSTGISLRAVSAETGSGGDQDQSSLETNFMLQQPTQNEKLDEYMMKLEQKSEELHNAQKNCEKMYEKLTQLDSLLDKQRMTTKHYFEMIQKLEIDKKQLEEERIKEQKKASEESRQRNLLFIEKHKLEDLNMQLTREVDSLRSDKKKRDSQVSSINNDETSKPEGDGCYASTRVHQRKLNDGQYVTMDLTTDDKSFKSYDSNSNPEDDRFYLVLPDMTPTSIQSLSPQSQTYTIKLATPVLKDKLDVIGGNLTGIYVTRISKTIGAPIQVGDKILSVGVFITDVQVLHTDLVYRTLEEATQILDAQANPKHADVVEMKLERDTEDYDKAQKWMKKNDSNGDFFFVKCNYSLEEESIQNGDIFCVTSSVTSRQKYWKAFRFDTGSKSWSTEPVSIPNVTEVLTRGSTNPQSALARRQAFKHRPYYRVLPTREWNNPESSLDMETALPDTVFPSSTKYCGPIRWQVERKLETGDVERYRHLLGYSTDMSFSSNSLDIPDPRSNVCRSISMPEEEYLVP